MWRALSQCVSVEAEEVLKLFTDKAEQIIEKANMGFGSGLKQRAKVKRVDGVVRNELTCF